MALKVLTKRQTATVRSRSSFLLIAKVNSRLRKAVVVLKVMTKRQKASRRTSLPVMATMTSLTPLRNTAVATTMEANTAVTRASTVQVESV